MCFFFVPVGNTYEVRLTLSAARGGRFCRTALLSVSNAACAVRSADRPDVRRSPDFRRNPRRAQPRRTRRGGTGFPAAPSGCSHSYRSASVHRRTAAHAHNCRGSHNYRDNRSLRPADRAAAFHNPFPTLPSDQLIFRSLHTMPPAQSGSAFDFVLRICYNTKYPVVSYGGATCLPSAILK